MNGVPLHTLKDGEQGIVTEVPGKQRLVDLGIVPGTRITRLFQSPLKDPAAYEIRGAVIALRREDSEEILVEPAMPAESANPMELSGGQSSNSRRSMTLALAGNPNVGKSTVFNTLTGLHQHTGNWAGKTVERASGTWKIKQRSGEADAPEKEIRINLVDIPGCYSLHSASPEEEISRNFLRSGACDGVIAVCDGTCLERNLILVLQILQLAQGASGGKEAECGSGFKVAVCINMMDQVRRRGLEIDVSRLSQLLGVPVCTTESRKPKEMRAALEHLVLENWLDGAEELERKPSADRETILPDARETEFIVRSAQYIADQVVIRENEKPDISRRIDRILTSPAAAFPIMALMLLVIFWITMKGANYPSQLLSSLLFSFEEPFYDFLRAGLGLPVFFCEMMACGMYRVLAWVVSVMLPPMAIFFPLFTLLEDWGFLPRAAFNLDRCFHCCSACGKQALTLCMGFGCNASAVVGSRIIDSQRERLLAMLTNSLVPCNGRFPILIGVIAMFFAGGGGESAGGSGLGSLAAPFILTAVILLGVAVSLLLTRILSATVLKGMASSFVLELPPYRRPRFAKVILRSVVDRTLFVLARAAAVAAPAGLLIYLLANVQMGEGSLLTEAADLLNPVGRLIGLDGVILLAFILGLPANEIVLPVMMMIYMSQGSLTEITDLAWFHSLLAENGWTSLTAVNVLIFTLMHWPCATTLLSIRKESGSWKWTAAAAAAPLALGIIFCGVTRAVYCIFLI